VEGWSVRHLGHAEIQTEKYLIEIGCSPNVKFAKFEYYRYPMEIFMVVP